MKEDHQDTGSSQQKVFISQRVNTPNVQGPRAVPHLPQADLPSTQTTSWADTPQLAKTVNQKQNHRSQTQTQYTYGLSPNYEL